MMEFSRRHFFLSAAALAAFARGDLAFAAPSAEAGAAWDLTDLYPSEAAWTAERERIIPVIAGLTRFRGTLGQGAAALRTAMQAASDAYRTVLRLYGYASLKADEDLRVSANQERRQLAQDTFTALGEALSWTSPEILSVGEAKIRSFLAADPGLGKFRLQLEDTLRQGPHTLTPEGEALLAAAGAPLAGPGDIRVQLATSDIPRPTVTLSDGTKARLDDQGYTLHRDAANRADRKLVFDSFWGSYKGFQN